MTYVAQMSSSALTAAISDLTGETQLAVVRFVHLYRLLTAAPADGGKGGKGGQQRGRGRRGSRARSKQQCAMQ